MGVSRALMVTALALLLLAGPTRVYGAPLPDPGTDRNGNGIEDLLDSWRSGRLSWEQLRLGSRHGGGSAAGPDRAIGEGDASALPVSGYWEQGLVRVLVLDGGPGAAEAGRLAAAAGRYHLVHDLDHFGGVLVAACDAEALTVLLDETDRGRVLLDRDGQPALAASRLQVGAEQAAAGHWQLGGDWSGSVAILDSGCDTAHGDLGDYTDDNVDGPPPAVGDAADWYSAADGWPLFSGYKVIGWQDVTDDFPEAQGPWDYHHHGTALASVVAGSGTVDPLLHGVNRGGRLTVVKFYDFDQVWHAWAGDFLAACAWVLDNRDTYRIRTVLAAVNWEADLGLSQAMAALVDAGIVPVAAMGNHGSEGTGPGYPARLPDVLAVGSVNPDGAVSAFSGRGLPGQPKPDVLAPGGEVLVADNEPDDSYSLRQGTSLAAAHAAGALYMLDEALEDNGVHLPADRRSVLTRMALVRGTAARVDLAEDPLGGSPLLLPAHDAPDQTRGWGLLRVDAAVPAVLTGLFPGADRQDTLGTDQQRPVAACRLALSPQVRYLIEAVPGPGLDVALELITPGTLDGFQPSAPDSRQNSTGPGGAEFLHHRATDEDWAFVVVRRVSGAGSVTLRVDEDDAFTESSVRVQLPGNLTGAPNVGRLTGSVGPTVVIPSRVEVDQVARSVNVIDATGTTLPGWPVFVFPSSSAQGGLSQPVVWDLDGTGGDEIVLSSGFGSIYFFNRLGAWTRIDLGFNVPLTRPVGLQETSGQRRVGVVDAGGTLRSWSWGPVQEVQRSLGYGQPLDPAVGQLAAGPAEELAIAFAAGVVLVTDTEGNVLPGWPVDLGTPLETPPVLCDLDDDGLHEIILPDLDSATGVLHMHSLTGDGQPGPGHGAVLPAPAGGRWLRISHPVVAGRYGTGDLRVTISGLMDNGLSGAGAGWFLGTASLLATGQAATSLLPGFEVGATTSQGVLSLKSALLPGPVAWDYRSGTGTDEAFLFGLEWTELVYGLTAIDGSAAGWLRPTVLNRPLENRIPVRRGGSRGTGLASAGAALVAMDSEVFLQVQVLDDILNLIPYLDGYADAPCWSSARGDQRNSGAYPLRGDLSPVGSTPGRASSLTVFPNPGHGRFQFRLGDGAGESAAEVTIYDLRGRRVRALRQSPGGDLLTWDGRDRSGRQVAAGTYLAVARRGGMKTTARFVITR